MRSFRPDKVASAVRSIVSDAIAHRLQDPRISRFCSVTRVEVSRDLHLAKVYVSVMGSEADERKTLAGLQHAVGHLRRIVGRELSLRTTPELRFEIDQSIKGTADMLEMLKRVLPESDGAGGGDSDGVDPVENETRTGEQEWNSGDDITDQGASDGHDDERGPTGGVVQP